MAEYHSHLPAHSIADPDSKSVVSVTNGALNVTGTFSANTTAHSTAAAPTYSEGTDNPLSTDLSGNLRVNASVNATTTEKATAADPSYVEGSTSNPLSCDLTGYTRVLAKQGGTWNITNVSGTVSLPTGAATAAKQPALGTAGTASSDVITVQGIASMTALKVDGSGVTQPVSGTFWQSTQPVSIAATVTVGGTAASGASVSGNPLLTGARAATAQPTSVADGQAVDLMADVRGGLITVLNAPRALKGAAVASATDNTSHTLIAAGAAGVFNDIEALWLTNTSATGTDVSIGDGTNTYHFYCPATETRGISVPGMLNATSAATAWTFQAATGVTTLYAMATYTARKG